MSQAFDFMSSLQSSESGIIVPILQMKLGMQRVCFLLSHRTAVLNFFGTSQGPISWKTIFPQIWCVCARGGGKRGRGGDTETAVYSLLPFNLLPQIYFFLHFT